MCLNIQNSHIRKYGLTRFWTIMEEHIVDWYGKCQLHQTANTFSRSFQTFSHFFFDFPTFSKYIGTKYVFITQPLGLPFKWVTELELTKSSSSVNTKTLLNTVLPMPGFYTPKFWFLNSLENCICLHHNPCRHRWSLNTNFWSLSFSANFEIKLHVQNIKQVFNCFATLTSTM